MTGPSVLSSFGTGTGPGAGWSVTHFLRLVGSLLVHPARLSHVTEVGSHGSPPFRSLARGERREPRVEEGRIYDIKSIYLTHSLRSLPSRHTPSSIRSAGVT